jgi:hypothetical protein
MGLLDPCLKNAYFQFEDKFCQKKDMIAMGNQLSISSGQ